MADKEDPRQEINRNALTKYEKSVPEFGETTSLLEMLNRLPKMYIGGTDPGAYGSYRPFENKISISPDAFQDNRAHETVLHELTHSLYEQMSRSYFNTDARYRRDFGFPTETDQQFVEGWDKLRPSASKLINPKEAKADPYRYGDDELRAFAVANHAFPKVQNHYPVPPHLNATLATEAAIMRDLYLRKLKQK